MRALPRRPLPSRALPVAPLLLPGLARAQAIWPERPIRWIVSVPPGGAADTLSRALAESIGPTPGQAVVVENRPGAGGLHRRAESRGDGEPADRPAASPRRPPP